MSFQEIFKLLVAKLYSERFPDRVPGFSEGNSSVATANAINNMLFRANSQWPGIIKGNPQSRSHGRASRHLRGYYRWGLSL